MSVIVDSVIKGSAGYKAGIKAGDTLVSIDGNEIMDVLDYRFYQNNSKLKLEIINAKGKQKTFKIKKKEYDEIGLEFETYLMDKQHHCKNKCIFCFIDQLPKGMRESLYFKDDDSRLSFLFGNYITLTNITEHEVERIIKMHISPINISVHTTNPELRVKMMKNKNAGAVLPIIKRFDDAGIKINCQMVLCPGYNDGEELIKTLEDLTALQNSECIAAVPVGLSGHREGLEKLVPFDKKGAGQVIDIIEKFGEKCLEESGKRRVFAADEFYILAERDLPDAAFYEDFLQLENGVGLVPLMLDEFEQAFEEIDYTLDKKRKITMVTGGAALPFIQDMVDKCLKKWDNLECSVYAIKNNFFGGEINVAGLVTATDIIKQLSGKDLGDELLVPSVMLRDAGDMFLDSITLEELSEKLNVRVVTVNNDGYELLDKILGKEEA